MLFATHGLAPKKNINLYHQNDSSISSFGPLLLRWCDFLPAHHAVVLMVYYGAQKELAGYSLSFALDFGWKLMHHEEKMCAGHFHFLIAEMLIPILQDLWFGLNLHYNLDRLLVLAIFFRV